MKGARKLHFLSPKFLSSSLNSLSSKLPTLGTTHSHPHIHSLSTKHPNHTHTVRQRQSHRNTKNEDEEDPSPPKSLRDSLILDNFRKRQLKARDATSSPPPPSSSSSSSSPLALSREDGDDKEEVDMSFEKLGLSEEMVRACQEVLGVVIPSEIQCVGIPPVLSGSSVVMSSPSGSGRTLAYLIPLLQLLRRDAAEQSIRRKFPRAVVLCNSEVKCDQVFHMAKTINNHAQTKPAMEGSNQDESAHREFVPNSSIGLLVGTPAEVLQQTEDGDVLYNDVRYLVLDEADVILDSDSFIKIQKILNLLKNRETCSEGKHPQSVLVTSPISKMLGEEVMGHLEHNQAGKVTAMLLEMDEVEAIHLMESPDGLKNKIADAIRSF